MPSVEHGQRCLITCEHGGNLVPPAFRACFRDQHAVLASHRGHDPGALAMARDLAARLDAPLISARTTRLLVDLNRSLHHPRLFSEFTRALPADDKRRILQRYYLPYRRRAEDWIAAALAAGGRVVHVSSHSFTPVLDGVVRRADVGLLYDPARADEAALCRAWLAALGRRAPELRLRRNYPYTGTSDGFTAHLRRHFGADVYVGIELEINQAIVAGPRRAWQRLRANVTDALLDALALNWRPQPPPPRPHAPAPH